MEALVGRAYYKSCDERHSWILDEPRRCHEFQRELHILVHKIKSSLEREYGLEYAVSKYGRRALLFSR
jgi:hypothetical protein